LRGATSYGVRQRTSAHHFTRMWMISMNGDETSQVMAHSSSFPTTLTTDLFNGVIQYSVQSSPVATGQPSTAQSCWHALGDLRTRRV